VTGAVENKWVPMDVRRDIVKAVLVVADQELVDAAQATVNYVYEGAAHERDALAAERDQALAAVERVKALHHTAPGGQWCRQCGSTWPCRTIQALEPS